MDDDALSENLSKICKHEHQLDPWMYFELVAILSSGELDCIILEG